MIFAKLFHESEEFYRTLFHLKALLLDLLDHVGPREWRWGCRSLRHVHLFGDASEPSDVHAARVCAAVLVLPDGSKRFFSVSVPSQVLANFVARKKQICVLELLWLVLALFGHVAPEGAHFSIVIDARLKPWRCEARETDTYDCN